MEALKASGVCRSYGKRQVLRDFSLTVEAGGFAALMGPSGSGKSTFLHIAAGLVAADAGSVEIGGRDVVRMSDTAATKFRRRHVGVVFQAFNLLNERTVRENVLMPLRLSGQKTSPRLAGLLERLNLAQSADKRPEELSGGEQQRVAIARALIAEPDVVLADEPTGNLDADSARQVCGLLRQLNSASDKTAILMVTHDPVVAACAQTVHCLKDGRIAASFDPQGDAGLVARRYLETYR